MRYRLILAIVAAGAFGLPGWSHAGVRVNDAQRTSRGHFRASPVEASDLRTGKNSKVVDLFDELPGSVAVGIKLKAAHPNGVLTDRDQSLLRRLELIGNDVGENRIAPVRILGGK